MYRRKEPKRKDAQQAPRKGRDDIKEDWIGILSENTRPHHHNCIRDASLSCHSHSSLRTRAREKVHRKAYVHVRCPRYFDFIFVSLAKTELYPEMHAMILRKRWACREKFQSQLLQLVSFNKIVACTYDIFLLQRFCFHFRRKMIGQNNLHFVNFSFWILVLFYDLYRKIRSCA